VSFTYSSVVSAEQDDVFEWHTRPGAIAPEPVRNLDYTRTLASVLRRPALIPVPSFGPRLLLGAEGAREIAEASQYVRPERLAGQGHYFRQPHLEQALRHLFGRDRTALAPIWSAHGAE